MKYALEFSTLVTWRIAAPAPGSGQWACRCPADGLVTPVSLSLGPETCQ